MHTNSLSCFVLVSNGTNLTLEPFCSSATVQCSMIMARCPLLSHTHTHGQTLIRNLQSFAEARKDRWQTNIHTHSCSRGSLQNVKPFEGMYVLVPWVLWVAGLLAAHLSDHTSNQLRWWFRSIIRCYTHTHEWRREKTGGSCRKILFPLTVQRVSIIGFDCHPEYKLALLILQVLYIPYQAAKPSCFLVFVVFILAA